MAQPAMSTPQYTPSPQQQYSPAPQQPMQQYPVQSQQPPQQQQPQFVHQQQLQYQQYQQQQQQQQQQQNAANSMPPPTVPASKPTDPTDLADALTSAGIDLKEEEARLAQFSSGGSFGGSYNVDPYTGMPVSQEDVQRVEQRRRAALRANHLNDPFLNPQVLSNRLLSKLRAENTTSTLGDTAAAPNQNADILALLSLACRERLNTLLTRSTVLARVRRRPQTIITGEWADYVEGVTPEVRPDSGSAVSPQGASLKRSFASASNFPQSNPGLSVVRTANLQNETAKALRALKQKEWEADQEHKRKKARRENAAGATAGSGTATPGGAETPTPGTPSGETPIPGERKISAKESRKQQASKIEEAASHRAANATANMMMGGFGGGFGSKKKKKTYSWMNAGGATPGTSAMGMGALRPGPVGSVGAIDTGAAQTSAGPDLGNLNWTGQRLGVWREDGERGKGIQIRDWVGALEGDGRVGSKAIIKAYLRM
ncbi:transcription initiation factor TFIID component TAF4, partial [Trichophaea hybrida]